VAQTFEEFKKALEWAAVPEKQKEVLKAVMPVLQQAEKLDSQVSEVDWEMSRIQQSVERVNAAISAIPPGTSGARMLDTLLSDLRAAVKDTARLEQRRKSLVEQAAGLRTDVVKKLKLVSH